jgi:hypothetical protein
MRKHICRVGGSNYYLVDKGACGFLNPPGHAEHNYSIVENRGGHDVGFMSLGYAVKEGYLPAPVKREAQRKLDAMPGDAKDEAWIASVYNYFRHCYSPDGIDRDVNKMIISQMHTLLPEHHLGYLFIKQFDLDHTPRLDLIEETSPLGKWHNPVK